MKSLAHKLIVLFIVMSLVTGVIGVAGAVVIKIAETALNDNNRALGSLSQLLASVGDSLNESAEFQTRSYPVIDQIASSQDGTNSSLREMGDIMLPRAFAISQMRYALAEAAAAERALLLSLNMRHLNESELKEARDSQIQDIESAMASLQSGRDDYLAFLRPDEGRANWDSFEQALADWEANHNAFMERIAKLDGLVGDLIRGGPLFASTVREVYDIHFVEGKNARDACERGIDALSIDITRAVQGDIGNAVGMQAKSMELVDGLGRDVDAAIGQAYSLTAKIADVQSAAAAATDNATAAVRKTASQFWIIITIAAAGMIIAAILGLIVAYQISQPLRKMVSHMARITQGDLTSDVPAQDCARNDEIGQLARAMQDMILANRAEIRMANSIANGDYTNAMPLRSESDQLGMALGTMVRTSNDAMVRVNRAVERVGKGAAAVSEASRSLSQGALTSASALEEISLTVNNVDQQAKENANNAQQANALATTSRDAAKRGYGAVTELVTSMGEIQQAGKQIASVAKLIDDIAFQTNLLALNAAVEAARAGRNGKGFSVVADEVRNLSGRSARAAHETGTMVGAMMERMNEGARLAERTDSEFMEIVDATSQVARLFEDISRASNEQSLSMAQIAMGLNQIDSVIQENTNNAGQTATFAHALSRQADDLRRMVAKFKLVFDDNRHKDGTEPEAAILANPMPDPESRENRLLSAPDADYPA